MILKFEELQKANNASDARLQNISVENAKLKEEVEVLKRDQRRLRQDKSDARLQNISVENAKLKEEVDVLKRDQRRLRQDKSDARLRNISVENAALKEEVDVLKRDQRRLRQDQSALQKEKERLKQEQVTLTERQNMLSQYQDQNISSIRSQLQQLRKNVTTEQEDLKDQLLHQNASLRHDVSQAEVKAAILERRFSLSQHQLPARIRSLQVRVSDFIFVAVADANGVTKRPWLVSFQVCTESKQKVQ